MTTLSWWCTDRPVPAPAAAAPGAVLGFHRRLPGYTSTPLVALPGLAAQLRVAQVLVKDESDRLGLPAFKMLGASWAVACAAAARTGAGTDALDPATLRRLLAETGAEVRLYTATAGNHGRAVARTARILGAAACVWTPASTPAHLASAIEAEGAELVVVPGSYDDAVREAAVAAAADDHAALVQDTAPEPQHDGAERDGDLPARVVEGYSTLFHEIRVELGRDPDVVVVPAGVGSLAQAAATYCGAALLTVEPTSAACLLTALRDGSPRTFPAGTTALAALNAGSDSARWRSGCSCSRRSSAIASSIAGLVRADGEMHGMRRVAQPHRPSARHCRGATNRW